MFVKYNQSVRRGQDWSQLHPYVLTDYGYCSQLDAPMLFHPSYENLSYSELVNKKVAPSYQKGEGRAEEAFREFAGVGVGRHQGLELLIDTEAYDYGFAPEPGEGIKMGISNFGDESPITVKGLDLAAGSVHQVVINPVLTTTTVIARNRFTPEVRGCYFQDEFSLADYSVKEGRSKRFSPPPDGMIIDILFLGTFST